MTEEQKKTIAAFRFGVICELVNGARLSTGEQAQLIRDKCTRKWQIPHSEKTRISRGTILRWMRRYRASNGRLGRSTRRIAATGVKAARSMRKPPWP